MKITIIMACLSLSSLMGCDAFEDFNSEAKAWLAESQKQREAIAQQRENNTQKLKELDTQLNSDGISENEKERLRIERERLRVEQERLQREEEQRRAEEQRRREEEQRRQEQQRLQEQIKAEEEEQRRQAEQRRAEEQRVRAYCNRKFSRCRQDCIGRAGHSGTGFKQDVSCEEQCGGANGILNCIQDNLR